MYSPHMATAAATTTKVFEAGTHDVLVRPVVRDMAVNPPKPLIVAAPTEAGSYPVVVFLHGWNMYCSWYECLLRHVASHGFIAVAPQLYDITLLSFFNTADRKDIETTKRVTNWIADKEAGLAYVLADTCNLQGVVPDLSRLALAGHSRGGDTAFAVALGLRGSDVGDDTPLALKFSALIGVDPVAGQEDWMQVEPKVLNFEPGSLHPGMPVLVIGTGLGSEGSYLPPLPPCAPPGVNHAEFYRECAPPRYHFVAKNYGHLDMLDDDGVPFLVNCFCRRNPEDTKELARRTMAGLMVAFLRAKLQGKDQDLEAVIKDPGLAPALLDQVEHQT